MQADDTQVAWGEVTRLLHEARDGGRASIDRILPLIYDDLRVLARRQLQREFGERTMQPTSLVHDAYLKLANAGPLVANDRAHFLAIAARAMRQVLVDDARRRSTVKRGGAWKQTTMEDRAGEAEITADNILALDEAIEELEPRQRQVVECRFFAGMAEQEIAVTLGVTERTVRRDWVKARAWLYRSLYAASHD